MIVTELELASVFTELADAFTELADAFTELADAFTELADAFTELAKDYRVGKGYGCDDAVAYQNPIIIFMISSCSLFTLSFTLKMPKVTIIPNVVMRIENIMNTIIKRGLANFKTISVCFFFRNTGIVVGRHRTLRLERRMRLFQIGMI